MVKTFPRNIIQAPKSDFLRVDKGAAFTAPYDWTGTLYVNPSASLTITMPKPVLGRTLTIMHVGSLYTLTIATEAGVTIGVINAGQYSVIPTVASLSSNRLVAANPTKLVVMGFDGIVYIDNDLVVRDETKGLVQENGAGGNFFRHLVAGGVAAYGDLGSTSEP